MCMQMIVHVCMCVCECVCVHACMYVYVLFCMSALMYVYVCVHVCVLLCEKEGRDMEAEKEGGMPHMKLATVVIFFLECHK